jgi:hypothetical protein
MYTSINRIGWKHISGRFQVEVFTACSQYNDSIILTSWWWYWWSWNVALLYRLFNIYTYLILMSCIYAFGGSKSSAAVARPRRCSPVDRPSCWPCRLERPTFISKLQKNEYWKTAHKSPFSCDEWTCAEVNSCVQKKLCRIYMSTDTTQLNSTAWTVSRHVLNISSIHV